MANRRLHPLPPGGGTKKVLYTLKSVQRLGLKNAAKALTSRNTCKACGLGMGGQLGGMTNELGEFPVGLQQERSGAVDGYPAADSARDLRPPSGGSRRTRRPRARTSRTAWHAALQGRGSDRYTPGRRGTLRSTSPRTSRGRRSEPHVLLFLRPLVERGRLRAAAARPRL